MGISFYFFRRVSQTIEFLIVCFFSISLFGRFLLFLYENFPQYLELFTLQIEIDHVLVLVGQIADNAVFDLCGDFFEGLSGEDVAAGPESDEFIESVVFEFGNRTGNVILTVR